MNWHLGQDKRQQAKACSIDDPGLQQKNEQMYNDTAEFLSFSWETDLSQLWYM